MPEVETNYTNTQALRISTQEAVLVVMCLYDGVV